MAQCPDIFNGARCKTYSWSQSHGDLEIRVRIDKSVSYEDVQIDVSKREICVEIVRTSAARYDLVQPTEILMEGRFEHSVDTESVYWLVEIEKEANFIMIYIDKAEEMWWKQLLVDEATVERGSRNYTVAMDQLDQCSRMAIDKLVKEQQQKQLSAASQKRVEDFDSPV